MLTYSKLDTLTAIYQRRAVRSYIPDEIERGTIEQLLNAAVQAPTALHAERTGSPHGGLSERHENLFRECPTKRCHTLAGQV